MSHETRSQKIFNCHSRPVSSICLHPSSTVCASAQEGPNGRIILWRVSDCSVLSVISADSKDEISADLNDGVISVAFSSSGHTLACVCSDTDHAVHVYKIPAISAASFDEENFAQNFKGHVKRVCRWKSNAPSLTGIHFDTGPRETPITFGRKHLRYWDLTKTSREDLKKYRGDRYLMVGEEMGSGFQCCLVMQKPEVGARDEEFVQRCYLSSHFSRATQATLTGMDNGDIYIWGNILPPALADKSKKGDAVEVRGRRRLSKISSAHKGGVTSLCRSSQGGLSSSTTASINWLLKFCAQVCSAVVVMAA